MNEPDLIRATYNAVGAAYAARYGDTPILLAQLEQFAAALPLGAAVLDVGCGAGRATRWLAQREYSVTGVDFSETMLALAHEAAPTTTIRAMDIRTLDFPDATFDGLWACFAIVHVPQHDVATTLREWHRVLKPDGTLCIITSLGKDEEVLRDEWLAAADGSTGHQIFFHHFASETLQRALSDAGFVQVVAQIQYDEAEMGIEPILVVRAST